MQAERVLSMVETGFFNSGVPLFRALKGFLVQFGLNGDPKIQNAFHDEQGGENFVWCFEVYIIYGDFK